MQCGQHVRKAGLNFLAISGNIRRRGPNTFQVRIYLGVDSDGIRRSHCKTIHGSESTAKKYAKEYIKKLNTEDPFLGSDLLLTDFIEEQNERDQTRLAPQTFEAMQCQLKKIKSFFKGKLLKDISPIMVSRFVQFLEIDSRLAPFSVARPFAILSCLLKKAKKLKLIKENPCEGIELPRKERKGKTIPLSSEEIRLFLNACDKVKNGFIYKVALLTGARPAELLALRWSDIDLSRRTLQITKATKHTKAPGTFLGAPKTASSNRVIFLDRGLVETFAFLKRQARSVFVFPTESGQLRCTNSLHYTFKKILKIAGIDRPFRVYDLRHSHASLLLEKGIPIQAVSARLGHSSINTTLSFYVHARPEQGQAAANMLTELFFHPQADLPISENAFIPTKSDFLPTDRMAEKSEQSRPIFSRGSAFIPFLSGNSWQESEQSRLKIPI